MLSFLRGELEEARSEDGANVNVTLNLALRLTPRAADLLIECPLVEKRCFCSVLWQVVLCSADRMDLLEQLHGCMVSCTNSNVSMRR